MGHPSTFRTVRERWAYRLAHGALGVEARMVCGEMLKELDAYLREGLVAALEEIRVEEEETTRAAVLHRCIVDLFELREIISEDPDGVCIGQDPEGRWRAWSKDYPDEGSVVLEDKCYPLVDPDARREAAGEAVPS